MQDEIIGILIIIAIFAISGVIKMFLKKHSKKAKEFFEKIEDAEIEARFGVKQ